MSHSGATAMTLEEWLEALIGTDRVTGSAHALLAAAAGLRGEDRTLDTGIKRAEILLTEDGELRKLNQNGIFLRARLSLEVDVLYVHPEVAAYPGVRQALEELGVSPVEPALLLKTLVSETVDRWDDGRWGLFWNLVRQTGPSATKQILEAARLERSRINVRTVGGEWRRLVATLLPGSIVPPASGEDSNVVLDAAFHAQDMPLLQALGATASPMPGRGGVDEPWFAEYEKDALTTYLKAIRESGSSPSPKLLQFDLQPFAGPLTPLRMLSPGAKARYVSSLLAVTEHLKAWEFGHSTQSKYPRRQFEHPVVWMIRRHGLLETSLGPRPVSEAFAPSLGALAAVLPVASVQPEIASALGLVSELAQLGPEAWKALLEAVAHSDNSQVIALAYLAALQSGIQAPEEIRARVGAAFELRPRDLVAVTADEQIEKLFTDTGQPHIRVGSIEHADALVQKWGLRPDSDAVRTEVSWTPSGEPEPLVDAFPALRLRLDEPQKQLRLIPCGDLRVDTLTDSGTVSTDSPTVLDGEALYFLGELTGASLLREISSTLGLELTAEQIDGILQNLEDNRARKLVSQIHAAADDAERLLLAIGGDALRRRIPRSLVDAVEDMYGTLDDRGIAELALVVHGVRVLKAHAEDLVTRGLIPPSTWGGGRRAVEFARRLGFAPEYAGFDNPAPEATLEVDGTPQLGPLHEYQQIVVGEIRELLRGEKGLRGLLSLPTGAGKTRVTIESLVNAMTDRELEGPILWVAQTAELCEQAIETWSEIWRAFGPTRRLTVSRLYSRYEAEPAERGEQVVVATVQKLSAGVFEKKQYEWLARATCLIVDEAHTSVGPQYTRLLEWQGMGRNRDRAPLIGLTATPFRGTNVEETRTLVARYGGQRLDLAALGGADAYPHLQQLGILSHVDHALLPGSEIFLSAAELQELEKTRLLPASASQKLGADVERNKTLLDSITKLDKDWPVLLFAASVEHAQTMAALLVRQGVSAAAISAETEKAARRHYIERFRAGELRVLTNYNVLTAGFDAPKVQAVYVARPTYSPNLYQQMIGRGLRGPMNGGTERCLLVNVADNVLHYGEQLAFHDFDYLWLPDTAAA